MAKKIIGIVLLVLAVALAAFVIISIRANMPTSGPWIGKITQYKEPYDGHVVLMFFCGIGSLLSLLGGIILIVLSQEDR